MNENFILKSKTSSFDSSLINFALWARREKRNNDETIEHRIKLLKILAKRVNLWDKEAVENYILNNDWENGTKNIYLYAYKSWVEFNGFTFEFKRLPETPKLPYVPLEKDIEQLIASFRAKYSALYQLIKETGFRLVEALRLTPNDFDINRQTVTLNKPAKGSNSGQYKMSDKLTSMMIPLIKGKGRHELIWKTKKRYIQSHFCEHKKSVAKKLGNPNLLKITIKSLRHFVGTMTYHKTKDIVYTQKVLRHKNIQNTMVYVHLINFEDDEWTHGVAKTVEEACKLIDEGFEYVCDFEGTKIFRKRK